MEDEINGIEIESSSVVWYVIQLYGSRRDYALGPRSFKNVKSEDLFRQKRAYPSPLQSVYVNNRRSPSTCAGRASMDAALI